MAKYRNFYGGAYRKGNISIYEAALFVTYVLAAVAVFGLGSVNLTWVTDFSFWIVVFSALGVFALDKQVKKNQKVTALEIACLAVAIGLPLAAAGYLVGMGIDISAYLTDPTNAFIMLAVSVGALIAAAKQD
jgi:uncharacterized membrane protein YwzB